MMLVDLGTIYTFITSSAYVKTHTSCLVPILVHFLCRRAVYKKTEALTTHTAMAIVVKDTRRTEINVGNVEGQTIILLCVAY